MPFSLRGVKVLGACLGLAMALLAQRPSAPINLLEAGRPRFRVQGVKEGLPHATVMSVTQDRKGLLWVGTQDGAAFHDGRQWTVVDMPEKQTSNYVHAVLAASDGDLWFARQDGGIARLRAGVWTRWTVKEGLASNWVHALLETRDAQGRRFIWAGTRGGGLARWDGLKWSTVDLPLKSKTLWKLAPVWGRPDALWVGGEEGTLVKVAPEGATVIEGLPRVSVNQILHRQGAQGEEEVWVSTYGMGVGRYRKGRWSFLGQAEGLPDVFCTDLTQTLSSGGARTLWVTTHGGLAYLEEGATRFKAYTFRSGLQTESLYRLYAQQDPKGPYTLWVGSSGAGLLSLREGGWRAHDAFSGLAGSVAWCLAEIVEQGRPVLLAASGRGLSMFDGQRWKPWPVPRELQGVRINALLARRSPGRDSELWVGALGALAHYRGGKWRLYGARDGLTAPAVSSLAATEDEEGTTLWAGTNRGLLRLRGDRWEPVVDGAFRDKVVDFLLDGGLEEGAPVLWIGARSEGLWRLHRGRFTSYTREGGVLPNDSVTHLALTEHRGARELWVATNGGGVAVLDPRQPERGGWLLSTHTNPSLPSDAVQAITADRSGSLWLATNQGVVRAVRRPGQALESVALQSFTEDDGLPSANGNPHASRVFGGGGAWVGTRGGLGMVDPRSLPEDRSEPPLILTRVTVNGQLRPGAESLPELTLRPSESRVGFRYALLAFNGSASIRYRTQLVGLDDQPTGWEAGGEREFSSLAAGTYRFQVWARDGRGQVAGPVAMTFQVLPEFWKRREVQLAGVLALAFLLLGALRARERLFEARRRQLEEVVSLRTADLRSLNDALQVEVQERKAAERAKDEFTALVSHELRTPLTAVKGALGILQAPAVSLPEARRGELMEMATRNTDRLLHLVNDLLDIKRIEAGVLDLALQDLELEAVLAEALTVNAPYAQPMGVTYTLEGMLPGLRVVGDPLRLGQVLANLLSNGAKFSRRGAEVRLGAEGLEGEVRVWVHNLGEPIPEAFHGRIFQKFAQAETGTTRDVKGTGLGLAISKALVEAMGGRIGFSSGPEGTTFWFTLPRAGEEPPHP